MAPRVSVLIDNYNYGRFLGEAIESVLSQRPAPEDLELVVVDDGSTDDSRAVAESFGSRVRFVSQARRGQTAAINRGFLELSGELVFLLDADDVWLPGKFAAVLPLFDDPKVVAVEHFLQDADAGLKPLPRAFPRWPERYRLQDLLEGRTEFTAISGLAFRRSALAKVLPLPEELFYYLDDWMLARCLFEGEVANAARPLALRRIHGANAGWHSEHFADPGRIERDLRYRAIYRGALEGWLAARGLSLAPAAREAESLELFRRRVLLPALRADPAGALAAWREGRRVLPRGGHARFRVWTALLAVLSPTLYLALYRCYAARAGRRWRERLLPER